MLTTFSILLPVFALIAAGFAARKLNLLGEHAATELSRFVIWLALPALLFDIMAHTPWQSLWHPPFIAVYVLATFTIFLVVLLWRRRHSLACASIEGVAAAYSNTGYLGFPLLLLLFGASSQIATMIATIIVVTLLFAFAIVLIESDLRAHIPLHLRLAHALWAVLKNPLVFAPIAGLLWSISGGVLNTGLETFLSLLGAAASPAALVSLGLFLADAMRRNQRSPGHNHHRIAWQLTVMKLLVQPAIAAFLALWVFDLEPQWALMAIVLAALPTGTGPYMLAQFYQRDALITANTILYSTVVSLFSITVILALAKSYIIE